MIKTESYVSWVMMNMHGSQEDDGKTNERKKKINGLS